MHELLLKMNKYFLFYRLLNFVLIFFENSIIGKNNERVQHFLKWILNIKYVQNILQSFVKIGRVG